LEKARCVVRPTGRGGLSRKLALRSALVRQSRYKSRYNMPIGCSGRQNRVRSAVVQLPEFVCSGWKKCLARSDFAGRLASEKL